MSDNRVNKCGKSVLQIKRHSENEEKLFLFGRRFINIQIVNNKQMRPSTCQITWPMWRLPHMNTRAVNDKQSTNSTLAFVFLEKILLLF